MYDNLSVERSSTVDRAVDGAPPCAVRRRARARDAAARGGAVGGDGGRPQHDPRGARRACGRRDGRTGHAQGCGRQAADRRRHPRRHPGPAGARRRRHAAVADEPRSALGACATRSRAIRRRRARDRRRRSAHGGAPTNPPRSRRPHRQRSDCSPRSTRSAAEIRLGLAHLDRMRANAANQIVEHPDWSSCSRAMPSTTRLPSCAGTSTRRRSLSSKPPAMARSGHESHEQPRSEWLDHPDDCQCMRPRCGRLALRRHPHHWVIRTAIPAPHAARRRAVFGMINEFIRPIVVVPLDPAVSA